MKLELIDIIRKQARKLKKQKVLIKEFEKTFVSMQNQIKDWERIEELYVKNGNERIQEISDLKTEIELLKKQFSEVENSKSGDLCLTESELRNAFFFMEDKRLEGHLIIESNFSIPQDNKGSMMECIKDYLAKSD